MPISEVYNMDCMEYMKRIPDKFFDLADVDPPYGIGKGWTKDKHSKFYKHTSSYTNDQIPGKEYFEELFRISKHQIIWGANYYTDFLPARNSWIVWDKKRDYSTQHMAEGELAWTSFNIPLRIAEFMWNGACVCHKRYGKHPHEKPVTLYAWVYNNYSKYGWKIFDSHMGSQSSRIAAYKLGFDYYGCEIDEQYFIDGCERFKLECRGEIKTPKGGTLIQTNMFNV
jgi:site-specific DNA-methyltransferase (adenine-specific)